jgi:hypothetical protein
VPTADYTADLVPAWVERTVAARLLLVLAALAGGILWLWLGTPRVCVEEGVGDTAAVRRVCNVPSLTDPQVALPLAAVALLLAPDLTEIGLGSLFIAKWRDRSPAVARRAAEFLDRPAGPAVDDPSVARVLLADTAFLALVAELPARWRDATLAGFVRVGADTVGAVILSPPGGDRSAMPDGAAEAVVARLLVEPALPVLRALRLGTAQFARLDDLERVVAAAPARNAAGRVVGVLAAVTVESPGVGPADRYGLDTAATMWARVLVDLLTLAGDTPDDGHGDR